MKVNYDKVIGYVLLVAGLCLIIYSAHLAYSTFTGAKSPPEIFELKDVPSVVPTDQTQMPEVNVFPPSFLNQMGNLSVYSLLIMLLMMAGGKIADLGIKMIKKLG